MVRNPVSAFRDWKSLSHLFDLTCGLISLWTYIIYYKYFMNILHFSAVVADASSTNFRHITGFKSVERALFSFINIVG